MLQPHELADGVPVAARCEDAACPVRIRGPQHRPPMGPQHGVLTTVPLTPSSDGGVLPAQPVKFRDRLVHEHVCETRLMLQQRPQRGFTFVKQGSELCGTAHQGCQCSPMALFSLSVFGMV